MVTSPPYWLVLVLIIWLIFNIVWLKPKIDLIDQYKFLMRLLNKHDKTQEIENMFNGWNPTSPPSHDTSRKYFDSKGMDIIQKYNELNNKINSLHRLFYPNTTLIGKEFAELFIEIKELYEYFGMLIDSEFISALKDSRNRFPEIAKAVSEDLLPQSPKYPLWNPAW